MAPKSSKKAAGNKQLSPSAAVAKKAPAAQKLPKLPALIKSKLYKTGQTRGADDDDIYQNRVGRDGTVLIPYSSWRTHFTAEAAKERFKAGYIVLISPDDYVADPASVEGQGLVLGENALLFYETRSQWRKHKPKDHDWQPATSRSQPLGGQYVARIAATTAAEDGAKISEGFNTSKNKGAGIRVYEYASQDDIRRCRLQLEAIFWSCEDAIEVAVENGMSYADAKVRIGAIQEICKKEQLLDLERLVEARILNKKHRAVCPLCLEEISSRGFYSRLTQAAGREVLDITVTELNLFHIQELRIGGFNHRPYNLGWGHHHCNTVVKDAGIEQTLSWMTAVLRRNSKGSEIVHANKSL